jgi:hypothetical protein
MSPAPTPWSIPAFAVGATFAGGGGGGGGGGGTKLPLLLPPQAESPSITKARARNLPKILVFILVTNIVNIPSNTSKTAGPSIRDCEKPLLLKSFFAVPIPGEIRITCSRVSVANIHSYCLWRRRINLTLQAFFG